jgi:hypothetical protein
MNLNLPISFRAELRSVQWKITSAVPVNWTRIGDRICLRARIQNVKVHSAHSHTWVFGFEHLRKDLRDQLTDEKRDEVNRRYTLLIPDSDREPFDVLVSRPLSRKPATLEVDPWKLRDEFLSLKDDNLQLLAFLREKGAWRPRYGFGGWRSEFIEQFRQPAEKEGIVVPPEAFWFDRQILKRRIREGSEAPENIFPTFLTPLSLQPSIGFPFYSHSSNYAWDAIETSVVFDLLRGKKFALCGREDCGKPFLADRKGKKFCCYDCAHLATVRRGRQQTASKAKT